MKQEVAPPLAEGRYRLTDVLGVGGMAVVYRAHDTRLDVSRAIKMLRPELDDRARERFDTEARTMAKLHHPNIVLVHDVADDGDRAYLVMEYIEGGSISDRLHAFGAMPPRMACDVTIAVLSGLAAAHEKGIVHRDIKPHNIMVSDDGTVKVTDFGIAQVSDMSSTKTGAMIGTWAYMAPEQRADAKHVDGRADLFAMGCTLYKMLTNLEPFDLYNTELHEELFEKVPPELAPVIKRATRYKAGNRYANAEEMRQALEALRSELPPDPEDVPPLGASIEGERAAFMPTIFSGSTEVSNPTLSRPTADRDPRGRSFTWGVVALVMVALVFIAGGALAGLAFTGGLLAITVTDDGVSVVEPVAVPDPVEVPGPAPGVPGVEPGVPSVDPDAVVDGTPVEPDPPVEPDAVDPEPRPDPKPTEPAPVAAPSPQPAPVPAPVVPAVPRPEPVRPTPKVDPVPRPDPRGFVPDPVPSNNGTYLISVNSVPPSTVCVDGRKFCGNTPWTHRLEPGTYTFDLSPLNDPSAVKSIPYTVGSTDKKLCWDFNAESACK
ncbi:MAG: serine/threonine-protein kinase [Myxococcota bacterium]